MNMIAIGNQPFSVTSDQGFIDMLAALEPSYLIPSTHLSYRCQFFKPTFSKKIIVELATIFQHLEQGSANRDPTRFFKQHRTF